MNLGVKSDSVKYCEARVTGTPFCRWNLEESWALRKKRGAIEKNLVSTCYVQGILLPIKGREKTGKLKKGKKIHRGKCFGLHLKQFLTPTSSV